MRWILFLTLLLTASLSHADELQLLGATAQQADASRERLLSGSGAYLSANSKIRTGSINSFKRMYPLYLLPPSRPDDIICILRVSDGVILAAEVLEPENTLVLLLAHLKDLSRNYTDTLAENTNGSAILHYAHLAYSSGQSRKAKALLRRAFNLPLAPEEVSAAKELQKLSENP